MLWAVFRNGRPEVVDDEITAEMTNKYRETGDVAFLIISKSIINVFEEEDLAQVCCAALKSDYPLEKFGVVRLHPIVSTSEWS